MDFQLYYIAYSDFCKRISSTQLESLHSRYNPADNDPRGLFSYIWTFKQFHDPKINFYDNPIQPKDDVKARKFREAGNSYYSQRRPKEAMMSYTKSIVFSETEGPQLALGYANRSAILLEMGQYSRCVRDIERALEAGYPTEKREKLAKRKERALKALEEERLAGAMANLKVSPDFTANVLPPCCQEEKRLQKGGKPSEDWKKRFRYFFDPDLFVTPELESPHPKLPFMTSAAEVGYTKEKGRFAYATRDIFPGEMIYKSESFSGIAVDHTKHFVCTSCFDVTWDPVPCRSCTQVIFCHESCRDSNLMAYHEMECPILAKVQSIDQLFAQLMRILFQDSFENVKKAFEKALKAKGDSDLENSHALSNDLETYFLFSFRRSHSRETALTISYVLLKLVELIGKWTNYMGKPKELSHGDPIPEKYLDLATVLFYLHSIYSHTPTDIFDRTFAKETHNLVSIPAHLFMSSCRPNALGCSSKNQVLLLAHRLILKGQEITIAYKDTAPDDMEGVDLPADLSKCNCSSCERGCTPSPMKTFCLNCPNCKKRILNISKGCRVCKLNKFTLPPSLNFSKKEMTTSALVKYMNAELAKFFQTAILGQCAEMTLLKLYYLMEALNMKDLERLVVLLGYYADPPSEEEDLISPLITCWLNFSIYHLHQDC